MKRTPTIVLVAVVGMTFAHTQAWTQDKDDNDDAARAPATEQVTRASRDLPELILGSKEDEFTVNQKDFQLIAGQGIPMEDHVGCGTRIQVPHRSISKRLDEPDRHR